MSTDRPRHADPANWNDGWEPGDPLYSHPAHQYGNPDSQTVRFLFEILLDGDYWMVPWFLEWAVNTDRYACEECLVSWAMETDDPRCWNCGKNVKEKAA